MMRTLFVTVALIVTLLYVLLYFVWPSALWSLILTGPILLLGIWDMVQTKHAVRRNFPLIGNFRYLFEAIRPEISQYFIESNTDGTPFNRVQRSLVYQRAKNVRDTIPFGTQFDVYEVGYEWLNHSIVPDQPQPADLRCTIGADQCEQPYNASRLNISAMSYGSLSGNAILAMSMGAKLGNFAHNTGEGGISPYHREGGGDLIWQIGTGYFGCRDEAGEFCPDLFKEKAQQPQVKMIELKLSQGAKPGHGGILPAVKVTPEIAKIRHVPVGKDVISPPAHAAFSTPIELLEFLDKLRNLSGGKPVGFKLCIGKPREFIAVCKAMLETGMYPDFITVDGGEGGTGAAPVEFSDHIGYPLVEGLIFVHNALVGCNLREKVRVIAVGKIVSGFDIVKRLALGADLCYSARGMMMAAGCIQALKCNSNHCPVGVATQNVHLTVGLVPEVKKHRVYNFHKEMIHAVTEIMGATGVRNPDDLKPWHLMRRVSPTETRHYADIYPYLQPGALLTTPVPEAYKRAWHGASAESFARVDSQYAALD